MTSVMKQIPVTTYPRLHPRSHVTMRIAARHPSWPLFRLPNYDKREKKNKERERRPRAESFDRNKKRDRSPPSAGEGDFVIWWCLRTLRHDQSHVLWTQW
jgi:hypothetical protein